MFWRLVVLIFALNWVGSVPAIPVFMSWTQVKDGHPIARQMFSRHYSYNTRRNQISMFPLKNRNYSLFVGPGQKMVLLTEDQSALFVWRKFISGDGQQGVNCAVFRNEGSMLASDLIREAMTMAWERWPGERLYTYVNAARVTSHNPGYCFLCAGWKRCGVTKHHRLLILEALPNESQVLTGNDETQTEMETAGLVAKTNS